MQEDGDDMQRPFLPQQQPQGTILDNDATCWQQFRGGFNIGLGKLASEYAPCICCIIVFFIIALPFWLMAIFSDSDSVDGKNT